MHTPIPFPTGRTTALVTGAMHVTLAYENLSAALWASETLPGLCRQFAPGSEPCFTTWNFSALGERSREAQVTAATRRADLIVIAFSDSHRPMPASVETWLQKGLAQRRGARPPIAALFGAAEPSGGSESSTLRALQGITKQAGSALLAPSVDEPALSVA